MNFNYPLNIIATDDPYLTYKWMRDEDPAHYSETENVWVLTRYADCSAAFKDWKTWSSQRRGNLLNDLPDVLAKLWHDRSTATHFRARDRQRAFTPSTVAN
jgi:cytochrome P450